jgi:hypothetical protein
VLPSGPFVSTVRRTKQRQIYLSQQEVEPEATQEWTESEERIMDLSMPESSKGGCLRVHEIVDASPGLEERDCGVAERQKVSKSVSREYALLLECIKSLLHVSRIVMRSATVGRFFRVECIDTYYHFRRKCHPLKGDNPSLKQ